MPRSQDFAEYLKRDRTAQSLILSNLITLMIALIEGWSVITVMWIYWVQSIIIGFFVALRMLSKDLRVNTLLKSLTANARRLFMVAFFCVHYGLFHLGYAVFLSIFGSEFGNDTISGAYFMLIVAIFFFNHLFSFLKNRHKDRKLDIGQIMMSPYIRIFPMHITIILGFVFVAAGAGHIAMIIFMALKTIVDVIMHRRNQIDTR